MEYTVLLLPLVFVVVWCAVLRFLAWSSGWTRLAERFAGEPTPGGVRMRDGWIGINWADYNGCVTYEVDANGLHISLWPIFAIGHAPLFIPWSEMHVEEVRKHFGRRGQVVKLAIGDPVIARLRLPERIFEAGNRILAPSPENDARREE